MIGAFEQTLLAAMIVVIMLGMGASLRAADVRAALRQRRAFLTGMACQFGLMPLIAVLLAKVFALPAPAALALIMIGATPGGTTSNLFTFWARGDVALSIAMTVASTLAAVVMMPLLIWLYVGASVADGVTVPFANIAVTLVLVLAPAAVGYAFRARSETAGRRLETAGSVAGVVLILLLIVNFLIENGALVRATPTGEIAAAVLLSVIGFVAGRAVAAAVGLSAATGRTVALETGIQNTPLTITVIGLSFPAGAMQDQMLLTCAIYAVAVVLTAAATAAAFRRNGAPEARRT
jgi:BASS family bile acid:Na+ symporter